MPVREVAVVAQGGAAGQGGALREWSAGLEKGLAIIEAFDVETSRMSAATAARLTGMTRSSARRHLMMLVYLGFAATDGKVFWLTPRVLRLGTAYLSSGRLPRLVQPFLQRLAGATQESAFASVLDGSELVFVARNGANPAVNTGFVLGASTPPFVVAAGLAIVSSLPQERATRLLDEYQIRLFTPHTYSDKSEIARQIEKARHEGFALSEQQLEGGIRGVAVPLKNSRAETIGAISISVRIDGEEADHAVARLLPPLRHIASELRNVV